MDESLRSKVLESLDTNSISLISASPSISSHMQTTESNSRLLHLRSMNSPLAKNDENAPSEPIFERKEFAFNSNSTPTKKNENIHQKFSQVRKRRSQLKGAKPRVPSNLNMSASKLELIDDTNLTSLPFPHPKNFIKFPATDNTLHCNVNKLRVHDNPKQRHISYVYTGRDFRKNDNSTAYDTSDSSASSPLVLVEDYIVCDEPNNFKKSAKRKISIADLKSKINKRSDSSLPVKLKDRKKRCVKQLEMKDIKFEVKPTDLNRKVEKNDNDNSKSIGFYNSKDSISLDLKNVLGDIIFPETPLKNDKYFSELAINQELVKCVVCETPLYEFRTLVDNKYKEIVCGHCAEKYERAAKLFEDYEFETSLEDIDASMGSNFGEEPVVLTRKENDNHNRKLNLVKNLSNDNFSEDLVQRLQMHLQNGSNPTVKINNKNSVDSTIIAWFLEARQKLRWRWRVCGLLPQFTASNKQEDCIDSDEYL